MSVYIYIYPISTIINELKTLQNLERATKSGARISLLRGLTRLANTSRGKRESNALLIRSDTSQALKDMVALNVRLTIEAALLPEEEEEFKARKPAPEDPLLATSVGGLPVGA